MAERAAELAVKFLGVTAHHRTTRFRAVWHGGRPVAYEVSFSPQAGSLSD